MFNSLTIFAFLWTVAALFRLAATASWIETPLNALLTFQAVWTLLRPSDLFRFLCLLTLQSLLIFRKFPYVNDLEILTFVVTISILWVFIRMRVFENQLPVKREIFFS